MTESVNDLIHKWNEQRLDLFAISQPNNDTGEFHGVIRFYHKDQGEKVATKCIRVSSTASTQDVIETLREKFRSDMRMLSQPVYALYVTHVNGEWRRLEAGECPLMVQLEWVKDNRDGRFLVKNEGDKYSLAQIQADIYGQETDDGFNKLDSKRKSKKKKKQKGHKPSNNPATHLYEEVKESQFTRTISNPDFVVKKNRQMKHAKALQAQSTELTIYNDLSPTCYFVKVLASPIDQVDRVVEGALAKLGVRDDPENFLLAKCIIPVNAELDHCPPRERGTFMNYDECPVDVLQKWDKTKGTMVLVLQPPPANYKPEKIRRKRPSDSKRPLNPVAKPKPAKSINSIESGDLTFNIHDGVKAAKSPQLLEIRPLDERSVIHKIWPNVTEVGFVPTTTHNICQYIKLPQSAGLLPRHCVLANMEGIVTVTPHENARVVVDGKPIRETYMLENASSIILGQDTILIFLETYNPDIPATTVGISGDVLSRKILEAQSSVTTPNIQKPINQPFRPKKNPSSEDAYPTPIIQYAEEPGKIVRSKTSGYTAVSLLGTGTTMNGSNHIACLLPAQIEYQLGLEDTLLTGIFQAAEEKPLTFRLAPSYALYLCVRFHFQVEYRTPLVNRITHQLQDHIELNHGDPGFLAFWMANSSELLNFLRQDKHLSKTTEENQEELAQTVQMAFKYLVNALEDTLLHRMDAFLSTQDDDLPNENGDNEDLPIPFDNNPTMYDIIEMLNNAMSLLRRCRVNAALTIQLFSQLFHFINMYLFNIVVKAPNLCCKRWGTRIRLRLSRVEAWAEKQGLELAAECHLARVTQAMNLLKGSKYSMSDVAEIRSSCFKLNSLQLEALLTGYSLEPNEKFIPLQLISQVVMFAKEHADQLTREDGRDVTLDEDPDLQLPFLLPEDGYTSDVLRGVPSGLHDFIEPLQANGLCNFIASPEATGLWTVYFMPQYSGSENGSDIIESDMNSQRPIPEQLILQKKNGGLGLSIVAARGTGQAEFGIYIKSVVPGGAAYDDGRLVSGDLLVAVDSTSLHGLTQDRAADEMRKTGDTVKLTIIKDGARIYGLDQLLSQPSPQEERKQYNLEYKSPEQVRNGLNLTSSGENYKHISNFNSGYEEHSHSDEKEPLVKLNQSQTMLPVPPSYLLNATAENPEYHLPPHEQPNLLTSRFDHEYSFPPADDQMVTVKQPIPPPSRHSKQSSGDASSSEPRPTDVRDGSKSARKSRHRKDDKSSRPKNKDERRKRTDSHDSKPRSKNSDTLSTGGTLGRRSKGAMWADPQQRLIQEQLDSMRDEEITELKKKSNKTAKDEERLRVLISEQEFSRQLQRDMVQSGTSEIDSMSEEDFANIPDRPDRDRLQKYAEMVSGTADEDENENDKIKKQQQLQQEQIIRQKEEAKRRENERRRQEEEELVLQHEAEEKRIQEEEQRRRKEQRRREREEEHRRRELEEEQKHLALQEQRKREHDEEQRKREHEQEEEERLREQKRREHDEEIQRQEREEKKRQREEEQNRLFKEEEKRIAAELLEEQQQNAEVEMRRIKEKQDNYHQQKWEEGQRMFEEQKRKLEEERRQMELERRELEHHRREIEKLRLEEDQMRRQRETQRQEVDSLKKKALEREQRSKEKERIRKEQQELELLKQEINLDDFKAQRPKWEQQQAQLRDLEDTIEQTLGDKPKKAQHVYAAEISSQQPRIDERLEKERKQLEDQLSRPYTPTQKRAQRPTSSYIPQPANHPFNKRPLSSYNPKIPTLETNNQSSSQPSLIDVGHSTIDSRRSYSDEFDESFNSPGVIGNQELYNDPREKKLASIKRDNSILRKSQPDPSKLAFKDRHKLFEGQGQQPMKQKPKMSKKLMELEEQFGGN